jgi:hypothetical protein
MFAEFLMIERGEPKQRKLALSLEVTGPGSANNPVDNAALNRT